MVVVERECGVEGGQSGWSDEASRGARSLRQAHQQIAQRKLGKALADCHCTKMHLLELSVGPASSMSARRTHASKLERGSHVAGVGVAAAWEGWGIKGSLREGEAGELCTPLVASRPHQQRALPHAYHPFRLSCQRLHGRTLTAIDETCSRD